MSHFNSVQSGIPKIVIPSLSYLQPGFVVTVSHKFLSSPFSQALSWHFMLRDGQGMADRD